MKLSRKDTNLNRKRKRNKIQSLLEIYSEEELIDQQNKLLSNTT